MNIDLSHFRESFFQDAEEHTSAMEAGLLRLESGSAGPDDINAVFRAAHSIKGAAGTFGFEEVTCFTHALESLLDRMRDGRMQGTSARYDLLLSSLDELKRLLEAAKSDSGATPGLAAALAALDRELASGASGAEGQPGATSPNAPGSLDAPPPTGVYRLRFTPAANLFQTGMDPLLILRELSELGAMSEVEVDVSRLPRPLDLDPERCYLSWSCRLQTAASVEQIRDVFIFVEDGADISIEPEADAQRETDAASGAADGHRTVAAAVQQAAGRVAQREAGSLRVSTQKVDKLIDLVGELVIAQSMAGQALQDFDPSKSHLLEQAFEETQRYTRELQQQIMGVRMVPIGAIFSRFPRQVRDIAASLGKQIQLEISGEDTELDKGVVEGITDPLTHLIRNAADHGVESPEQRRKSGKPEEGWIRLRAFHQSGNVVIEIEDDGAGLDAARIREKAVERGLIAADAAISEAETYELVLLPGFSTKRNLTDLSGRGVGMDVVKRNVESLNGSVALSSRPGHGVKVRINLPLTLAILDGLSLKVGAETFVLPLVSIIESLRPKPEQVRQLAGGGEVIVVRGEPLPLVRLHELFQLPAAEREPSRGLAVIVEHETKKMALFVDELLGHLQVVIKSLESNFRRVDGVLGATILGDGRAALILDVSGLAQIANTRAPQRAAPPAAADLVALAV